jgi:catechol 2,3-dioxygenase-like lactoylglutathione lyase family enzyme
MSMKRLHVHVGVTDLEQSIAFYSALFGAPPSVQRDDYAKWMLEDPRVNFAISHGHAAPGIEHLGIQAETPEELAEVTARLTDAARPVLAEGETICCYARSEKSWTSDPQGVVWEAFHTMEQARTYGSSPALDVLAAMAPAAPASGGCC